MPIPLFSSLLTGLTLGAAFGPLLLFLALFQLKEWRVDRLREHLRREGWLKPIWGRVRPAILVVGLLLLLRDDPDFWALSMLSILTSLTAFQLMIGKVKMPVWTSKALLVFVLSCTLLLLSGFLLSLTAHASPWAVGIVYGTPLIAGVAWILLMPLDMLLKRRTFTAAETLRGQLPSDVTVIGIAGSVGKTTVKELLRHLLQDLPPQATPEHVNTEMGVAMWLQKRSKRSKLLIVELGAYRKREIALMCRFLQPTIGVMTALGGDHLGLFGSEQAIVDANAELLTALPPDGHAFLLADNKRTHDLKNRAPCPVTLAGMASDASVRARLPVLKASGATFTIGNALYHCPLQGFHQVSNATLAIAVAMHLGVGEQRIRTLLETFAPSKNTFAVRTEKGVTILDDTYNVSLLSFAAAIDWARTRTEPHKILLTSGLQELGKDEARFLKELGAHAKGVFERVIFTTPTGAASFRKGFEGTVEVLGKNTKRVDPESLLTCIGRMQASTIHRLLPS